MENIAPVVESTNAGTQLSFQWEETTTVVSSARKAELQNHYNEMYWYFREHFDYGAISSPLRIRAFDSAESFAACMTFLGKDGASNAFYSTGLDRVFVNQSHLASWGSMGSLRLFENPPSCWGKVCPTSNQLHLLSFDNTKNIVLEGFPSSGTHILTDFCEVSKRQNLKKLYRRPKHAYRV